LNPKKRRKKEQDTEEEFCSAIASGIEN